MTIKIVTDSTCDLPDEVIKALDISVVPMYINIGQKGYLDGVDISRQEFYENLPNYPEHPTTAAPGTDKFRRVYEQLIQQGATQIISIHISPSLSAVLDVARSAAQEVKDATVEVFDSRQLSLGTGFLVELAGRAAQQGKAMGEIMHSLKDQISRSHVFASLDTLEYLRRSGRMNGVVSGIGNLLQIKPILRMYDGKPTVERVRTQSKAIKMMLGWVKEIGKLEKVAIVHTNAAERAQELLHLAAAFLPSGTIPTVDITPVIGANIGPGAAGFALVAAES
jgi:DegV family protein with EDD domain